jgi:hypothetical protein
MKKIKRIVYISILNILFVCLGLEILFASIYFYKGPQGILTPDILYEVLIAKKDKSGKPFKKAKLQFDQYNSPTYINGLKFYKKNSRMYNKNGLTNYYEKLIVNNNGKRHLIGVYGDSYTEGLQVEESDTFVSKINTHNKRTAKKIDLINFAVGGTGTIDQLNRVRSTVDMYDLKGMVLFFMPQNDVLNNSVHPQNGTIGYSRNSGKDCRAIKNEFIKGLLTNSFSGRGLCYYYLRYLGFTAKSSASKTLENQSNDVVKGKGVSFFGSNARDHWFDVYSEPRNYIWKDAWDNTLNAIDEINEIAIARDIPFSVVIVADSVQIFYTYHEHYFRNSIDFHYPNEKIMSHCNLNNIRCFDSLPFALDYIDKKKLDEPYLSHKNDGHYSKLGHNVMVKFLTSIDLMKVY